MKCAVAICLTILLLSVVSTNAQWFGYPGWGHRRWGGPGWGGPGWGGRGFGGGRGLQLLGSAALLTSGNRLGQLVGGAGLIGALG